MLPGFSKDNQFMAIEGFSVGTHNRSDEAFTVADLEKFRSENGLDTVPKKMLDSDIHTINEETDLLEEDPDIELEMGMNEKTTTTAYKPKSVKTTTTTTNTSNLITLIHQ